MNNANELRPVGRSFIPCVQKRNLEVNTLSFTD